MSDPTSRQPDAIPPTDPRDRRREPRLEFTNRCNISIAAPAWAITPKPLVGRTEDITWNGLRVDQLRCAPGQAEAWKEAVRDDVDLKIEISLPEVDGFPTLKGRIVWVFEGEFEDTPKSSGGPLCSIGILFSIMREKERKALEKLFRDLSNETLS